MLGLGMKVWVQRDRLDEQLARGADPRSTAMLEHRAEQLESRGARDRLAAALDDIVREAHSNHDHFSSRLAPRRAEVRACEYELRALARRLSVAAPVDAQGVAMTSGLVLDGASPLYYAAAPHSLRHVARSARMALDRPLEIKRELAAAA